MELKKALALGCLLLFPSQAYPAAPTRANLVHDFPCTDFGRLGCQVAMLDGGLYNVQVVQGSVRISSFASIPALAAGGFIPPPGKGGSSNPDPVVADVWQGRTSADNVTIGSTDAGVKTLTGATGNAFLIQAPNARSLRLNASGGADVVLQNGGVTVLDIGASVISAAQRFEFGVGANGAGSVFYLNNDGAGNMNINFPGGSQIQFLSNNLASLILAGGGKLFSPNSNQNIYYTNGGAAGVGGSYGFGDDAGYPALYDNGSIILTARGDKGLRLPTASTVVGTVFQFGQDGTNFYENIPLGAGPKFLWESGGTQVATLSSGGAFTPGAELSGANSLTAFLSTSRTISFSAFTAGVDQTSALTFTGLAFGDTCKVGQSKDNSTCIGATDFDVTSAGNGKIVISPINATTTCTPTASTVFTVNCTRH